MSKRTKADEGRVGRFWHIFADVLYG